MLEALEILLCCTIGGVTGTLIAVSGYHIIVFVKKIIEKFFDK